MAMAESFTPSPSKSVAKRAKLSPLNMNYTVLKNNSRTEDVLDASYDSLDGFQPEVEEYKVDPCNLWNCPSTDLLVAAFDSHSRIVAHRCPPPGPRPKPTPKTPAGQPQETFYVTLEGFWRDANVNIGDKIRVFGKWKPDNSITVCDGNNMLITNAETLVSCTSISSATFCARKTVLSDRIRGGSIGEASVHLLVGNLTHKLFQNMCQAIEANNKSRLNCSNLETMFEKELTYLMQSEDVLESAYSLKLSLADIMNEVKPYIKPMAQWIHTYLVQRNTLPNMGTARFCGIRDIEENIWCSAVGVKGKVDVSVQVSDTQTVPTDSSQTTVKLRHRHKVVPLELKTGKISNSIEHQGQVALYTTMLSTLMDNSQNGLLLYLKNCETFPVKLNEHAMRGLVQLRNQLAGYLRLPNTYATDELALDGLLSLPPPIHHHSACISCHLNTACGMFHTKDMSENRDSKFDPVAEKVVEHLGEAHMQFYYKWIRWIYMEWIASNRNNGQTECIENCRIVSIKDNFVTFNLLQNASLSSFGKGCTVIVDNITENHCALFMATVVECADSRIVLRVDRQVPDRIRQHTFRISKYESAVTAQLSRAYITRLMANEANSARVRRLVVDLAPPSFCSSVSANCLRQIKSVLTGLNAHQLRAVVRTIRANDYVLIKGMPGCGKTQTIVMMVMALVKLGKSLLIAAYTHSAVDNVVDKLRKHDDCPRILRLGRKGQIAPSNVDLMVSTQLQRIKTDNLKALTALYENTPIVACTCLAVGQQTLTASRTFDYAIVDEASLCLHPPAIAALLQAKTFVLVGDTKQLKPLVQSKQARNEGMDKSLFEVLAEKHPHAVVTLSIQYRMNRCIMDLANTFAYENKLECASSDVADGCIPTAPDSYILNERIPGLVVSSRLEDSVVLLNTANCGQQFECKTEGNGVRANFGEAKLAAMICGEMIKIGVESADIGVICIYRHQIGVVHSAINECMHNATDIYVSTGDQYQGHDKRVIIVSLCYTDTQQQKPCELLNSAERLTVVLSRAKHKLVIIGHIHNIAQQSHNFRRLVQSVQSKYVVDVTS